MNTHSLIYQPTPKVIIASNTFINVPIILRYEDTNLIEMVQEAEYGFTTQIPIFHSDGTYLAKVRGMRIFPTEDGKKAGLITEKYEGLWVCKMNNRTLFEIHLQTGDTFKTVAELFTPDGYFVKCSNDLSLNTIISGSVLNIGCLTMSGCTVRDQKYGIRVRKDGTCSF